MPDWLAAPLAPYAGVVRSGRTLAEELHLRVPSKLWGALRHLAVLVMRPDLVGAGGAAELLDHLEDAHGLIPLKLRVFWMEPAQFNALYRFKLDVLGETVWLHHKLCQEAPVAVALLGRSKGDGLPLSQWLNALKGPSLATAPVGPGDLRARFGRASSFHAVVHSSEDVGALLYDSTQLFGWQALREALAELNEGRAKPVRCDCRHALLTVDLPPGSTVFRAAAHVQRRIAAAFWLHLEGRTDEVWAQWWRILAREGEDWPRGYAADRAAFQRLAADQREVLETLIWKSERSVIQRQARRRIRRRETGVPVIWEEGCAGLRDILLLCAAWFLCGYEAYDFDHGEEVFRALDRHDVPIASGMRTLLQAGLLADLNPAATWQGEALWGV